MRTVFVRTLINDPGRIALGLCLCVLFSDNMHSLNWALFLPLFSFKTQRLLDEELLCEERLHF